MNTYLPNDRSELILSIIDNIPKLFQVVDLGCNDGSTLLGMARNKNLRHVKYTGVDLIFPKKKIHKDEINFIKCDLNNNIFEIKKIIETADLVLLLDVLEHLHDPEIFLENLSVFMKKNAQLIIIVPNAASIRMIFSLFMNEFPRNKIGFFDSTHRSWFTTNSLKKLVPAKFNVNKLGYIYSKKIIYKILQKIFPTTLSSQFYILIEKV